MNISDLTFMVGAQNVCNKGRFYLLWRDGNFIIIQAEPWWRHGFASDPPHTPPGSFVEEVRALCYLQEVIQSMLDTIVLDDENNWAYLVRLKDGAYRLVYSKRQLVPNCLIWTKVVELDDIELTRFVTGLNWEGIYEGREVDIYIAWHDDWGHFVSYESNGQKLVHSRGVGHYFFDLEAHVSKNGVIVGIMKEAAIGRRVTRADRSAVFEAVADILQHGVFFAFDTYGIYITERGVRFTDACSAKYYQDRDALAKEADFMWKTLARIFNPTTEVDPYNAALIPHSRSCNSTAIIMPRLPSPGRPITLTPEEAQIRWVWSIVTSDDLGLFPLSALTKLQTLYGRSEHSATRRGRRIRGDRRALLPSDDVSSDLEAFTTRVGPVDGPLVVNGISVTRHHPYRRPRSRQLLLPQESDLLAPET
ncbi:hypothetical protein V8E55_009472 [Tylopilus felleus]